MSADSPHQQQQPHGGPGQAGGQAEQAGRGAVAGTPVTTGRDVRTAREPREAVASPGKVMRIGAMVRQLLEEVRHAPLDEAGRTRMREIYETSVRELGSVLSPDLAEELTRFALPLEQATPTEAELRVAQAQLVGWLEGLFHGIQATLFAQQMSARNQLAEMRGRQLMPGRPGSEDSETPVGGGTYL